MTPACAIRLPKASKSRHSPSPARRPLRRRSCRSMPASEARSKSRHAPAWISPSVHYTGKPSRSGRRRHNSIPQLSNHRPIGRAGEDPPSGSKVFHSPARSGRLPHSARKECIVVGRNGRTGWCGPLRRAWSDTGPTDVRWLTTFPCCGRCSSRCCCRKPYSRGRGCSGCG